MTVTVFTRSPMSIYATSTEALLKYLGVEAKLEFLVPGKPNQQLLEHFGQSNCFTPAVIDSEKGLALNQQVAVNRYLLSLAKDNKGLYGKEPQQEYETLMWTNRVDSDIIQKVIGKYFAIVLNEDLTQEQVNAAVAEGNRGFEILEEHLVKHTYLVGEQLTIADIEAAGLLYFLFFFLVGAEWQKSHPATVRWAKTILNGPAYQKKFNGKFNFSKDGNLPGGVRMVKQVLGMIKPEEKKEKKAPKPAQPQAEPAQAPKPKHPLEALGKPSIPIDELKRTYSNKETREEALPWFWNTFYNDEEWSIWRVDYKYNDELKLTFMSNNLIGGFFSRLTGSIKYMFGAAVVFGENNNNGIRGAFVIRGHDFMTAFDVAPDWESFEFTRLDAKNPEHVEELNNLWAWDKPVIYKGEPREIADGKVLK